MSTDSEDELFICTPLQRSRSQISSSQAGKEKKPNLRACNSQINSTKLKVTSNNKRNAGKRYSQPGRSSLKYSTGEKKPLTMLSLAKQHFLYGSCEDQAGSSQKRKSPIYSQTGNVKKDCKREEDEWQEEEGNQQESSRCPSCMMPWKTYDSSGKQKIFHIDECLEESDLSNKPECTKGASCTEILEKHFWTFSHNDLAVLNSRRGASQRRRDDEQGRDRLGQDITLFDHSEDPNCQGTSIKRHDEMANVGSRYKNNNVEKSNINRGDRSGSIDKGKHKKNSFAVKDVETTENRSAIETKVSARNTSKSKSVEVITAENSTKDIDAYLDCLDVPDLELNTEPIWSISGTDSEDNGTVLLAGSPCIEGKAQGTGSESIFDQSTQYFVDNTENRRREEKPRTNNKEMMYDSSDSLSSTAKFSQSRLKNVSRNIFRDNDGGTKEYPNSIRTVQERDSSSTDELKFALEDDTLSDVTHCSNIEDNNQCVTESHRNTETFTGVPHKGVSTLADNTELSQGAGQEEDGETGRSEADPGNLAGTLDDCEEDELMVNLVEAAVEKYFGDVVDRVRARKNASPCHHSSKQDRSSSTPNKPGGTTSPGNCRCKCSNHSCIHVHFHIDSTSPKKGSGQTSIMNYFQRTKTEGKAADQSSSSRCRCECGGDNVSSNTVRTEAISKRLGVSEWQVVLSKMKQMSKLPSVSSGSSVVSEGREGGGGGKGKQGKWTGQSGQRKCPFYKIIQGTNVVVDAFSYGILAGITAYFLSHFHYDHYQGLTKNFSQPIYCSHITARLVHKRLGVAEQHLHPLPLDQPQHICGLQVTLLEANHCPGAVMFLFKLPSGMTLLHTGDFRAHSRMESYPAFWNCAVDVLYLDTTYCNPVYDFPNQEEVVEACVSVAKRHVADNSNTLIVVGSYTIGKERVFKAIAAALDCRVWVNGSKRRIVACLDDPDLQARITYDKKQARVHVLPMAQLTHKKLMRYVCELQPQFRVVAAIKPTGWEHSGDTPGDLDTTTAKHTGNVYIYGMPYSEHSSFTELRRFVQFTQPKRIIPTVNVGNPNTRRMMEGHFTNWLKKKAR